MSSDPPSDVRSPEPEPGRADTSADRIRALGEPLLAALDSYLPGSRELADAFAVYSFAAAVRLGLSRELSELCRETARLQDIGKVYVEHSILGRDERHLSAAEGVALELQYPAGARLALGAGIPEDICEWMLQTRERWDGLGPEHLAADAIPLPSRIARGARACAHVLRQPSPAGTAGQRALAVEVLREKAGRELDPSVSAALIGVLAGAAA